MESYQWRRRLSLSRRSQTAIEAHRHISTIGMFQQSIELMKNCLDDHHIFHHLPIRLNVHGDLLGIIQRWEMIQWRFQRHWAWHLLSSIKEIRSDEIEQKREEFFSYRLCSWSTVLSTRLLNRFSSSSDSRRLPLLVGPFAVVDDRCSFATNGEWATVGFVGVTLMVVEGFLFRSTDNEVEEQESVCSLIQEKN